MSALGRVWRRAPAWRVCVILAIASTALAAMFPPAVPAWLRAHGKLMTELSGAGSSVGAGAGKDPPARYAPEPPAPAAGYTEIELPAAGIGRSGLIPFAGRQLPLPTGAWQDLVLGRDGGAMAVQVELLDRVTDGNLTGLALAISPSPLRNAAIAFAATACYAPAAIAHLDDTAVAGGDPLVHECWDLTPLDMSVVASAKSDVIMQRGLDRLQKLGVTVPGHMLALRYLRSDDGGWFTLLLLVPDRRSDQSGASRKIEAWARRYALLLHKSFDGMLTPAELTPAASHDPD